jgi:hypothetical protein
VGRCSAFSYSASRYSYSYSYSKTPESIQVDHLFREFDGIGLDDIGSMELDIEGSQMRV